MKILFIEPYPTEGPSSRYRVEQYVPYFEQNGIKCIVRPFVSSKFYKILYKKGYYLRKSLFFLWSSINRFFDLFRAVLADIIFIHLEAFPFGPPYIEYFFKLIGKKIVYDLDDAIYLGKTSPANTFIKKLKCPSKIEKIIKISNHIITCNNYLADYVRKFNNEVTVIHTSVDIEKFKPIEKNNNNDVTIGWIGSHSTAPYLEQLKGIFTKLGQNYKINLRIVGAGTEHKMQSISNVNVTNIAWSLKDEIEQFQSLDIGVYPLPENEWTVGKTGFKTIQYMSVGVPCVVSNVGTNKNIIENGVNGFLVNNKNEWIEKLSLLINDKKLRQKIGSAGRKTVEERFSLQVNAPKYLNIINKVKS